MQGEATVAEFKGTPGPWCVENVNSEEGYEHDICLGYDVPKAGSPILLASVYFNEEHDGPITQRQANWNAKLIAAAPDLLAACRALVETFELADLGDEPEDGEYGDGKRALLAGLSAIAKANGQ